MSAITTSFFDLYKIGPGPSSSHTYGSMKAAGCFLRDMNELDDKLLESATHIEVFLYGSLSATGKGHGTDNSIVAGLLGWKPETCDAEEVLKIFSSPNEIYQIKVKNFYFPFQNKNIIFSDIHHFFPYSNTIIMRLKAKDKTVLEKEYYSLGGGFVIRKDKPIKKLPAPPFPYSNMQELKKTLAFSGLTLSELLIQNEMTITKKSRTEIMEGLNQIYSVMERAVEQGTEAHGVLPGPIKLKRKGAKLFHKAQIHPMEGADRFLVYIDAFAIAAAEENAAGHTVVTAPTSGSSGILPAILYLLRYYFDVPKEKLIEGLIVAAVIGFIVHQNASISGAEVGCQGEIGVASSMVAALISHVNDRSIDTIDEAAEIALEHSLGLTCDPIGGYVQIPCIERNAFGAVGGYNAYLIAAAGDPKKQRLGFDEIVRVMYETGRDMCDKYKETSTGGLATCQIFC